MMYIKFKCLSLSTGTRFRNCFILRLMVQNKPCLRNIITELEHKYCKASFCCKSVECETLSAVVTGQENLRVKRVQAKRHRFPQKHLNFISEKTNLQRSRFKLQALPKWIEAQEAKLNRTLHSNICTHDMTAAAIIKPYSTYNNTFKVYMYKYIFVSYLNIKGFFCRHS